MLVSGDARAISPALGPEIRVTLHFSFSNSPGLSSIESVLIKSLLTLKQGNQYRQKSITSGTRRRFFYRFQKCSANVIETIVWESLSKHLLWKSSSPLHSLQGDPSAISLDIGPSSHPGGRTAVLGPWPSPRPPSSSDCANPGSTYNSSSVSLKKISVKRTLSISPWGQEHKTWKLTENDQ